MRVMLDGAGFTFPGSSFLFRGLSVSFESGLSYAITGPSGSGKSTLLSIVAGWTELTEGTISQVGGSKTNWVFQNSYGMPRRTAIDHVMLPLLASGGTRHSSMGEAISLMRRFGLGHRQDHEFRALSGGEAQRLMLARAIASKPDLLLIDEPTAQLDTDTSRVVNAVINEVSGEGRIVLVATHDPGTTSACDEVVDLTAFSPAGSGLEEA